MSTEAITLDAVAARTDTLVVACSRCDRAGRYRLHALIINHGRRFGIPSLLAKLSADCPKRKSVSAYDLCGIHCPELSALFLTKLVEGTSHGNPREAGLSDETIAAELQDAADALLEGLS